MATKPSQGVLSETKVGINHIFGQGCRQIIITSTRETVLPFVFSVVSLPFVSLHFGAWYGTR